MTRTAFETCETITYEKDGGFYTDRVVGRVRPSWGLRQLRTASGDLVNWINVLTYR